jgi:uridine monophosphate synthetase
MSCCDPNPYLFYMRNQLIAELFDVGVIQYGDFTLKSGAKSQYYFDMRLLVSYPTIYAKMVDYLLISQPDVFEDVKLMTGIHFGGVPLASYISSIFQIPQIYIRDAPKEHGTQRQIEGEYTNSPHKHRLFVVDDVLTTGTSIREKYAIMEANGLDIETVLVILDRREKDQFNNSILGVKTSEEGTKVVKVHSIFTIGDIMDYVENRQASPSVRLYYENPVANALFEISLLKKTNIVVAADLGTCREILELLNRIHPYIAGVKLHVDTLADFTMEFAKEMEAMSIDKKFIIIEDRKLADIGAIGVRQLGGFYRIGDWADAVTVHSITGIDQIDAIHKEYPTLGLIPVAELSCRGNLIGSHYIEDTVEMCIRHPAVCGFVGQSRIYSYLNPFECLTFSPGIHLTVTDDDKGQQYRSKGRLGRYWIVGRGIYDNFAERQVEMAMEYQREGWDSFWHRNK